MWPNSATVTEIYSVLLASQSRSRLVIYTTLSPWFCKSPSPSPNTSTNFFCTRCMDPTFQILLENISHNWLVFPLNSERLDKYRMNPCQSLLYLHFLFHLDPLWKLAPRRYPWWNSNRFQQWVPGSSVCILSFGRYAFVCCTKPHSNGLVPSDDQGESSRRFKLKL